jgi:aconitate hydratase
MATPRCHGASTHSPARSAFQAQVGLDTAREATYYRHGGIMKYVLRDILDTEGHRP